jgi:hypothetical protein
MLKELNRNERVKFLEEQAKSPQNQLYSTFFDYYNGKHFAMVGISESDYSRERIQSLRTRSGIELYDNTSEDDYRVPVCSNWCRPIIETIADFTRGIDEEITITAEEQEEVIKEIWEKNQVGILMHQLAQEAGIFGKTWVRFRGGIIDAETKKPVPVKISVVDPGSVYEITNPLSDETEGIINYFQISRKDAERLYPDVRIDNNKSMVFYAEEWDALTLRKYIDGILINTEKDISPYPFMPFKKIQANLSEASDISDVISLNDELNITLTYINEIFKYHAFPLYAPKGSGIEGNVLDPKALKEVKISPKSIMNFPLERIEGKGVDQSVIQHLETIQKNISIVSQVPMKLLTAEMDGSLSGVALARLMSGVIKQAEVRRDYIRQAMKTINNMIISASNKEYTEIESTVTFPDIIKIDTNERLDEMIKKASLGISKETIFEELGYDYAEEEKKRQTEFDNSLEKRIADEQAALNNNNNDKPGVQQNSAPFQKKGTNAKDNNAK